MVMDEICILMAVVILVFLNTELRKERASSMGIKAILKETESGLMEFIKNELSTC